MTTRKKAAAPKTARAAGEVLRDTWESTLNALTQAEREVEKQVKQLMKRNKIEAKDAATLLKTVGAAVERERRNALKQLESRVSRIQGRIAKERRNAGKLVDEAVRSALATFNIPSRQEVADLTRKVDALSHKIDALKR